MSLAAKLPYDHPYAGGFSGIGSQPLPTDSDCLTYLAAVKAADGAGVEVSVATAVDAFVKELKATPGLFDAIKASCILCGARTLSGALVPLAGTAPTSNGFATGDYTRGGATPGLKGDESTTYLDTNTNPASFSTLSISVWLTEPAEPGDDGAYLGAISSSNNTSDLRAFVSNHTSFLRATNSNANVNRVFGTASTTVGLVAASLAGTTHTHRSGHTNFTATVTVQADPNLSITVFKRNASGGPAFGTVSRIAFYHIGEALDLAKLDTAVSNLIAAIGNSL
jgi:hypothetical protein